jgi:predicted dinucleotide-binding enzyme
VEPSLVPGEHDLFLCGDDPGAKDAVRGLGRSFGWECFVDLGGIVGTRAQEAFVLI